MASNHKDSTKKETTISIRIGSEDAEMIDNCAAMTKISRSELIRNATAAYIFLTMGNPEINNPKLYLSHNLFRILLKNASEKTIDTLAQESFNLGSAEFNAWKKIVSSLNEKDRSENLNLFSQFPNDKKINLNQLIEMDNSKLLEFYIDNLVRFAFSPKGQNWFEKIRYSIKDSQIIFTGRHHLGNNFSIFIKKLLGKYMTQFNYILESEESGKTTPVDKSGEKSNYIRFIFHLKEI
ncbi:MAG: ribbon-helix-helix domain-containing protein [Promethearchaeota archaeon]